VADVTRLREFVRSFTRLVDGNPDEERIFRDGKALLADLVTHDDWLPEAFAKPHPDRYQQFLLYCDPLERFSVVSFVWGPGQKTPVHDHTVWGVIGMLRGGEEGQRGDQAVGLPQGIDVALLAQRDPLPKGGCIREGEIGETETDAHRHSISPCQDCRARRNMLP